MLSVPLILTNKAVTRVATNLENLQNFGILEEFCATSGKIVTNTRMWANAQRARRPAKYMWRPVFNAAKFG